LGFEYGDRPFLRLKQPLLNICAASVRVAARGPLTTRPVDDQSRFKLIPQPKPMKAMRCIKICAPTTMFWQLWQWARWVINPAVAITNTARRVVSIAAPRIMLIGNLSQFYAEARPRRPTIRFHGRPFSSTRAGAKSIVNRDPDPTMSPWPNRSCGGG
jgi:hypothetical protein